MFRLCSLVTLLGAAGKLVAQHAQEAVVSSSGEALMQMAASVRNKIVVSAPGSKGAARVAAFPHSAENVMLSGRHQGDIAEGAQYFIESEKEGVNISEDTAHSLQPSKQDQSAPSSEQAAKLKSLILESWKNKSVAALNSVDREKLSLPRQSATGCGVLWYYHLSKCAGTSILRWLLQLRAEGAIQEVLDYTGFKKLWSLHDFNAKRLQPLVSKIDGKIVAVHQHHNTPGLWGMDKFFSDLQTELRRQGCSLVRLTVLREPSSRLISHVNYDIQLLHSQGKYNWNSEADEKASYEQYLRMALEQNGPTDMNKQFDNSEVRYLLNNWGFHSHPFPMPFGSPDDAPLESVMDVLSRFEEVGITEQVEKSLDRVAALLGLPHVPLGTDNAAKKHDAELAPDIRELLEKRTRLDRKLYQYYVSKLSS